MSGPHPSVRPSAPCRMCGDPEGFAESDPFFTVRCEGADGCEFLFGEHLEWHCATCDFTIGTATFAVQGQRQEVR